MIKRIIFDLDNTLIMWKEEYWNAVNEAFEQLDMEYTNEDVDKIKSAIDYYEDGRNYTYNKEQMKNIMEEFLNYKLPNNFVDIWMQNFSNCAPSELSKELTSTLEYLQKKYDLVVLTNWLKESQKQRLKKSGIEKYFSEVYAPETFKMKPNKEGFEIARGNLKSEECIVVGDSLKTDIQGAINANMKAIWLDNLQQIKTERTEISEKEIIVIHKITDLKKYL